MTNKNTHLNRPFFLKPAAKDYLWGGNRLNDDFSKGIEMQPLAETWECSTHPDGPSIVVSGEHFGKSLIEVLEDYPEYLGTHSQSKKELPILIKLIDAKKDLSVQVHPSDEYAQEHEHGQLGKTEMWYILDAARGTKLIYGFKMNQDQETLKKAIEEGTLEKYLKKVSVKKNDLYYIKAGTVHAIGAGALIAEVQENSNLTYRLYDYDRVDKNGKKRELHIEKGLAVAELKAAAEPRQPLRVLKYRKGCASELLCRCKYFEVHRMLINTERCREMVEYKTDSMSFRVLLCTDGCGSLRVENEIQEYFKGDCIFVPANSESIRIHGQAQFLDVRG
ncbi:MAG: type I phosphomannose isomerase catalytic subunit [Phascolarctobacterium sp.]|nr:type I phosphomannose isomerase catalytic subunit [Phascolarctobacterium sp.]